MSTHTHRDTHLPLESDRQPKACHPGLLPLLHTLHGSLWRPVGRKCGGCESSLSNTPKLAARTHPTQASPCREKGHLEQIHSLNHILGLE